MNGVVEKTNQFLTFTLGGERYAVEVSQVREVLEFNSITRVPRAPDFMRGVINLRGAVVPVVDLKVKFGMGLTEKNLDTCIIVTEVGIDKEEVVLGVLADAVQEVIELDAASIEAPPKIGSRLDHEIIKGMGKHNGEFLIILEIDRIFSMDEKSLLADNQAANK